FDASGDRLAVRYLSGETYLIDVDLLRDLPADPGSLSDADLRARACKALGDSGPTWAPTACGWSANEGASQGDRSGLDSPGCHPRSCKRSPTPSGRTRRSGATSSRTSARTGWT